MNSGPTAERVFEALKVRILGGDFRPGERLDPAQLATPLSSSITPVRDALHQLTGAGLVESRPSGGFHVPALDEPGLQDLYDWSYDLLWLATRTRRRATPGGTNGPAWHVNGSIAGRTAEFFLAVARNASNAEYVRAIDLLNARLHAVRIAEPTVLDGTAQELTEFMSAAAAGDSDTLRRLSTAYHRRRRHAAGAIVRAVYRSG